MKLAQEACTSRRHHHRLVGLKICRANRSRRHSKKARDAHAKQQLLIAEQHYRTPLREEPEVDDVINLGALLRSQGRLQEGSLFINYG